MPTKIPYLDETWNPIIGCSHCSPGCDNCWAEKTARRLAGISKTSDKYSYVLSKGVAWSGRTFFDENTLNKPLCWKKPRNIGVCFMGDLFHETVRNNWINAVFTAAYSTPQHNYLLLTKRPKKAKVYYDNIPRLYKGIKNVWLGVSVCNQDEVWKIDVLRDIPAAYRWVSFEPLLEQVKADLTGIDWVVIGAESGPNRRFLHYADMANTIPDGIPVYIKQLHKYMSDKITADIKEFPIGLQIQEYPKELIHE